MILFATSSLQQIGISSPWQGWCCSTLDAFEASEAVLVLFPAASISGSCLSDGEIRLWGKSLGPNFGILRYLVWNCPSCPNLLSGQIWRFWEAMDALPLQCEEPEPARILCWRLSWESGRIIRSDWFSPRSAVDIWRRLDVVGSWLITSITGAGCVAPGPVQPTAKQANPLIQDQPKDTSHHFQCTLNNWRSGDNKMAPNLSNSLYTRWKTYQLLNYRYKARNNVQISRPLKIWWIMNYDIHSYFGLKFTNVLNESSPWLFSPRTAVPPM